MSDWIGDPNLSREEKLARFEALGPALTTRPPAAIMPGAHAVRPELTRAVSRTLKVGSGRSYSPQMPGAVGTGAHATA